MAIIFTKQTKSQRNLIFLFLFILLITATVIWWGFFRKEEAGPEVSTFQAEQRIEINTSILEKEFLKTRQPFPVIGPFQEGTKPEEKLGRVNPFEPY